METRGEEKERGAIACFQLPFVGLSADVTSCSPARRVPERGTSPPAPSSATFQVSIRQEGLGGMVTEGWRTSFREAREKEGGGVQWKGGKGGQQTGLRSLS